ncbi:rhomboid family intramembrane serine protease [Rhodophyticola sp. CCM32]|uniref:rhomboid family intramembrane serine protease n=1 Tax=Rhodophyticola sp. CCM32 TaxID=2916397 RepID=UPI00107F67A4|nr:rhomboid family intramembrane serine protease [Rhodophyticola sp. CCM32]QBX99617.1 rhomboid family intramembrane serine protease [Rhodophyticola sp. CCM32]
MQTSNASPFNALPPAVIALAVIIGGIEALFQLAQAGFLGGAGGLGWRQNGVNEFGVWTRVMDWMLDNRSFPFREWRRFLTYPLIHVSATHAILVVVFVLALGKLVAEVFSQAAFLAVFLISSVVGGLGFVFLSGSEFPLVGGFPGAYGLIGAFTFVVWIGAVGQNRQGARAFGLIAVLAIVQLVFSLYALEFGRLVSNLSGFMAGFVMSFLVRPGGWQWLLNRLRQR